MARLLTISAATTACALLLADAALGQQTRQAERLRGGNENPPVDTDGRGNFRAQLSDDRIDFVLRYDVASEATESDITQAHLHVGNPGNNGGIVVWLCANEPITPPPGVTARECPPSPNRIEGEILATDVLADADGVVAEGDLEALARLIRQGSIYVNLHTNDHPAGEVRGQLSPRVR